MNDIQTTPTGESTARPPRTVAWGTTIAGAIALGLAVLVGLTEIAGLSIPFGTAGPGAVIVVGLLILLVGLVVVIRSGRSAAPTGSPGGSPMHGPAMLAPHEDSTRSHDVAEPRAPRSTSSELADAVDEPGA